MEEFQKKPILTCPTIPYWRSCPRVLCYLLDCRISSVLVIVNAYLGTLGIISFDILKSKIYCSRSGFLTLPGCFWNCSLSSHFSFQTPSILRKKRNLYFSRLFALHVAIASEYSSPSCFWVASQYQHDSSLS